MIRMDLQLFAHKKGVGSSRNGRDSKAKRLGVKHHAGEFVTAGSIIMRQRRTKSIPPSVLARRYVVCQGGHMWFRTRQQSDRRAGVYSEKSPVIHLPCMDELALIDCAPFYSRADLG